MSTFVSKSSEPMSGVSFVTHGPAPSSFLSEITLSTVCSAISRYVVHLPPVTNVIPVAGFVEIRWSRDTGEPGGAYGSLASGRQPRHAERTSARRTWRSGER